MSCSALLLFCWWSSHNSKILACMDLYIFRCLLVSFFSETRQMRRAVNRASWWCRSIRRYKFKFCLPAARRCSPWCQPSTSLLLLVAIMYTLQLEGGHVLLLIQVSDTYSTNCCSGAVVACCLSCSNFGVISCSGWNGNAMNFRR